MKKKNIIMSIAIIFVLGICVACGSSKKDTQEKENVIEVEDDEEQKENKGKDSMGVGSSDVDDIGVRTNRESNINDITSEEENDDFLTSGNIASEGNSNNQDNVSEESSHTHTWVHYDATGHYENVIIQEAYDEEVNGEEEYDYVKGELSACNVCGEDITGNASEHTQAHALAYEGGGWHSEVYARGYCYFCGGEVEYRSCSFSGYAPICSTSETFNKVTVASDNKTYFMYRKSCNCGKNWIMISSENGKGLIKKTWKVHHDAVTEQRWVQDSPAYDVCSGCGVTK